jgi:hypothetical protein
MPTPVHGQDLGYADSPAVLKRGGRFSNKAVGEIKVGGHGGFQADRGASNCAASFLRKRLFIAISYPGTAGHASGRRQQCLPSCLVFQLQG